MSTGGETELPVKEPAVKGDVPPIEHSASAYGVSELVGVKNRENMPGHLYFIPLSVAVPPEQEAARQEIEKVAAVLREVFQAKHPEIFLDYFRRLLAIAWGVFTSKAFRPESLSDLIHLRNEIVQRAGGFIKADYNKKLVLAVAQAIGMILSVTLVLQLLIAAFAMYHAGSGEAYWGTFGEGVRWDHSVSVIHLGALLAASMIGLLFASMARNLDPTFETLITPDADLMQPWVRLVFFGIAIIIIALIFQLRVVTVTFGESFSTARIGDNLLSAILIGFLLGLGERALPSQVERWSKDLVSGAKRSD